MLYFDFFSGNVGENEVIMKNPHFFLAYHQIFSFLSSTHTLS